MRKASILNQYSIFESNRLYIIWIYTTPLQPQIDPFDIYLRPANACYRAVRALDLQKLAGYSCRFLGKCQVFAKPQYICIAPTERSQTSGTDRCVQCIHGARRNRDSTRPMCGYAKRGPYVNPPIRLYRQVLKSTIVKLFSECKCDLKVFWSAFGSKSWSSTGQFIFNGAAACVPGDGPRSVRLANVGVFSSGSITSTTSERISSRSSLERAIHGDEDGKN